MLNPDDKMKVWNTESKEFVEQIAIEASDFIEMIKLLDNAAFWLVVHTRTTHKQEDTEPGKLADSLIKNLGYESVEEFLVVNQSD